MPRPKSCRSSRAPRADAARTARPPGIAFFEYVLQAPANRIGYRTFSLAQLKVIQEVITMIVFAGFATLYMREPIKLDFLWAGLCLVGASYFMFRSV